MKARGPFGYVIAIVAAVLLSPGWLAAQPSYTRSELENGARLYLGSCATCHGAKGDMVRGVALMSGRFQRASTDEELVKIIISGIAGTAMPPNNYSDLEAGMIVAFLRGTAAGDSVTATAGDSTRGRALFEGKGKCVTCHAETSRMAPSLSDIGVLRRPLELEQSLLDPSAALNPNFRFARLVTKTGTVVTGRLLNQSTFSVQILDSTDKLRAFDRSSLREFAVVKTSPMPSVRGVLDPQELADVVTYLTTLRGQR
jgi:putative heme-binding domain-containing protein